MADSYKTIRCPACGNVMKKVFVPSVGVNVDICADGCGGLYFDNKEFQQFKSGNDNGVDVIREYTEGKNFITVDENEIRTCPTCAAKMVKTRINGLKIQIDTCYSCGGVFLDNGELDIIRHNAAKTSVSAVKNENFSLREFYKDAQAEEHDYNTSYHYNRYCGGVDVYSILFGRHGIVNSLFRMFRHF